MPKFKNVDPATLTLIAEGVVTEVAPGDTIEVSDGVAADLGTQPQYWQPADKAAKSPAPDAAPAA